jgi:flavin reductase (DIM6/NTAB) family NADH-FMN oxidoreductase RutF
MAARRARPPPSRVGIPILRKTGGIILPVCLMVTPPTSEHFRNSMAALPTGVTIVTALGEQGPAGATANAVCSLSLEPPLMLACLDRGSRTLDVMRAHGRFGISVLAVHQEPIARAFASKAPHTEKFKEVDVAEHATVPILAGSAAWVVCALRDLHDGGDHLIAVGDVLDLGVGDGEPLVFFGGGYRALG